jgi:hypothetical protein
MIKMTRDARQKVISAIRLDQNRRKRWGQLEEQIDDGEELEEIRKLLRELSNRVKAVPLRTVIESNEK